MAAVVSVIATTRGVSPPTQGSSSSVPESAAGAQSSPSATSSVSSISSQNPQPQTTKAVSNAGDVVYVSRASALLSQVEQQLKKTPQTAVTQVLSNAASDILAQAQAESDPNQAKVLENLASRLQVAASSGSSALPPYSLSSLLGG